jgi:hypothetical protein
MRTEKETSFRPYSCLRVAKVPLPDCHNGTNERDVKHPQSTNLGMRNPDHGDVLLSSVADLIVCPHHAEILEHDEDVS